MKAISQEILTGYAIELSKLSSRAKAADYKNKIPRLSKPNKLPTASTLLGFNKRLRNWISGLERIEEEKIRKHLMFNHDIKDESTLIQLRASITHEKVQDLNIISSDQREDMVEKLNDNHNFNQSSN